MGVAQPLQIAEAVVWPAWTGEGKPRMNEAQCLRRLAIFDPGLPLSKADLLGCVLFPELQELHKRSFNLDW